MIKDSGNRTEFETGAVRDIQEGKGRCDLLPLRHLAECMEYSDTVMHYLGAYQRTGQTCYIRFAVRDFIDKHYDGEEDAFLELSIHYEEGAKKYEPNNWKKGINTSCYLSSGVRHYLKCKRGDNDERHDRAFLWNMMGLLWTLDNKPELDDIEYDEGKDD